MNPKNPDSKMRGKLNEVNKRLGVVLKVMDKFGPGRETVSAYRSFAKYVHDMNFKIEEINADTTLEAGE